MLLVTRFMERVMINEEEFPSIEELLSIVDQCETDWDEGIFDAKNGKSEGDWATSMWFAYFTMKGCVQVALEMIRTGKFVDEKLSYLIELQTRKGFNLKYLRNLVDQARYSS